MPKIVDKEQKRSEIATVAIKLFSVKGFEKTSIQDIANEAGIGKATFYHYFKTKNELLNQVSIEIINEFQNTMNDSFMLFEDPDKKIIAIFEQTLSLVEGTMAELFIVYMELFLIDMKDNNYGDFMAIFKEMLMDFRVITTAFIEEGKNKKIYRNDIDSKALAVYLVASLDGIMMHYFIDRKSFDLVETTMIFIKTFLNGIKIKHN